MTIGPSPFVMGTLCSLTISECIFSDSQAVSDPILFSVALTIPTTNCGELGSLEVYTRIDFIIQDTF